MHLKQRRGWDISEYLEYLEKVHFQQTRVWQIGIFGSSWNSLVEAGEKAQNIIFLDLIEFGGQWYFCYPKSAHLLRKYVKYNIHKIRWVIEESNIPTLAFRNIHIYNLYLDLIPSYCAKNTNYKSKPNLAPMEQTVAFGSKAYRTKYNHSKIQKLETQKSDRILRIFGSDLVQWW